MVNIINSELLEEKINIVMRQTDYSFVVAKEKLIENDYNELYCIREYLGITEKKEPTPPKSLNQEIYKQFRKKLHTDMPLHLQ